ncbi:MAG: DUF2141 domain-containing protein [Alphaproteobacteria bacterium]|nr:DUF2141 domain-containing protein [Alphaproteobacteria bacterium]
MISELNVSPKLAAAAAAVAMSVAANDAHGASIGAPNHPTCTGGPNQIVVVVENVKKSVGLIAADLYRDDPEHFLESAGREVQIHVAARAPVTEFCMHAKEAGEYAIAVYQDKDANGHLKQGAFGIPAEPYGVSNNPHMRFGPPKIEEALFAVASEGARVEIRLKN